MQSFKLLKDTILTILSITSILIDMGTLSFFFPVNYPDPYLFNYLLSEAVYAFTILAILATYVKGLLIASNYEKEYPKARGNRTVSLLALCFSFLILFAAIFF